MIFNSQICTTKEQSERLLALGLKPETADCILVQNPFYNDEYIMFPRATDDTGDIDSTTAIPAWSLHRLLCIIPTEYLTDIDFQDIMHCCIFATSTLYDDMINLIETLIKEGYIYSEYLK